MRKYFIFYVLIQVIPINKRYFLQWNSSFSILQATDSYMFCYIWESVTLCLKVTDSWGSFLEY